MKVMKRVLVLLVFIFRLPWSMAALLPLRKI